MAHTGDLLKIGDFAKLAGTNLRTLRYYEELGLLEPAERSAGGFRYYRPSDANRVRVIRELQELGLRLERIRELIGSRCDTSNREARIARVRAALLEHDRLLQEKIDVLREQRSRLALAFAKVELCRCCEHSPAPENNFCEPCARTGESLPEHLSALF